MFRIFYRFLTALAGLAVRSGRSKDLEIIVLRHQLTVLRRHVDRPTVVDDDRTLLAGIAAALPRRIRDGWIVAPETLLRWHRSRIARYWTQPSRIPGRPSTAVKIRSLVIEMATHNPFFISVDTREVFYAGNTTNPTGPWTTRAARNLFGRHAHQLQNTRALVRERGSQFVDSFEEIFRTQGLKILRTPVRTPVANAFAER